MLRIARFVISSNDASPQRAWMTTSDNGPDRATVHPLPRSPRALLAPAVLQHSSSGTSDAPQPLIPRYYSRRRDDPSLPPTDYAARTMCATPRLASVEVCSAAESNASTEVARRSRRKE